ncbi:hypothetical protein [Cylindrospermopsis raciborskii]|uniref:Glucose-inhibited division protein A n=1 Tax=Cylindrospermopsis raciborskii CENA302 TaxID=1170768 RepID=A0A9Q5R050_9CYAN|nr:hypothetical protein [Cylindrospermopsis raciborskii]MCZ2201952.1 hypothetical protein [Cylindrospermopsis raciborskii PAMP2012]MCZ2206642.1 hypothetical protein [Cylindrospermopsis raciborskii PAMP2011]NLQ05128.1 hypothetical protein [Cylindrospermopsis raciborskii MVCC19]OHY33496.1 hypothetical protein BCV64_09490 [Cylindrospermopsis raciborskii MVCC14]OHY33572.1 hypothetical protein BCV64_08405 [Cylindrospermopsis raciborskii MVCC14]
MSRSKIIAILTGAISILLAIAYLIVVQILDYRDMKPAPREELTMPIVTPMRLNDRIGQNAR